LRCTEYKIKRVVFQGNWVIGYGGALLYRGVEEAKKIEMKKRALMITNSSHAYFDKGLNR